MKLNIDRMHSKFQERKPLLTVGIKDCKTITHQVAKVIVVVAGTPQSQEHLRLSLIESLDNKFVPIRNSFRQIASAKGLTMVGFIRRNTESRQIEESDIGTKFRIIASNVLMDHTDNTLYEVKEVGGKKFVTRSATEDLSELLEASIDLDGRSIYDPQLAKLALASYVVPTAKSFKEFDFCTYVDSKSFMVKAGIIVKAGEDCVKILPNEVPFEEQISEDVDPDAIVESCVINYENAGLKPEVANLMGLEEYYRQVYGEDPEYFAKIKDIINQHSAI